MILVRALVTKLCLNLPDGFHGKAFMDNYYTSAPLLKELLKLGTWVCGTVRPNRKEIPLHMKNNSSAVPQFAASDQITLVHWYDHQDVHAMSTIHNTSVEEVLKRREKQPPPCPTIIANYIWVVLMVVLISLINTFHIIH